MNPRDVLLTPFRFQVQFTRDVIGANGSAGSGGGEEAIADGAFAEVTGLEASMEPRTIREGGVNYQVHQRAGQSSFATVVLRRGLARASDLWSWWALMVGAPTSGASGQPASGALAHRLTVRIRVLDAGGSAAFVWRLERAMPVKFKSADLNARASEIGIEELHLAHEGLFLERA